MSTTTGERKLRLLSLDGGGVFMDELNSKRKERSLPPLKPCDVFDLIGGTSTGGLIVIMLGRLEMDVDQCITAYNDLFPIGWSGNITAKFSSSTLGDQIKKVIEACPGVAPTDLPNDNRERRCRVFVCATAKENGSTTRLRSYTVAGELEVKATIIEAALATSAATSLLEPVTIGRLTFVDGALGVKNPVGEVESEALNIWGAKSLRAAVKCFVSVGTGVGGTTPIQDSVTGFFSETLVRISTETEATARSFLDRWRVQYEGQRYFRFNVQQGLQNVATADYLGHMEQRVQLERCISTLLEPQG
ncbi:phospholipase [Achaetomium macrosporum]|uniref:Phospholipase n=1 Tax=Achaetomium macrosporum TaxID=79813 RepID=A0AAN7C471_9PEZI|nr:phospholipase [Achaetomium macrosporum]